MVNTLRVRRAERRLSQMAVAKALEMSFNRYWRIEGGHTDPTPDEQKQMAAFFGVRVSKLFPGGLEREAVTAS